MANRFEISENTQPPPHGDSERRRATDPGGNPVDSAKRLYELRAQINRKKEENGMLLDRNREMELKIREQWRSLEEKDQQIVTLKDDLLLLTGSEARWKEKCGSLYEKCQRDRKEYESGDARWKAEVEKIEEECRLRNHEMELKIGEQRRSLEEKDQQIIILKEDLLLRTGSEARWKEKYGNLYGKCQRDREEYESSEAKWKARVEKIEEKCWSLALEECGRLIKENDAVISELKKRIEQLEKEKALMENAFRGFVVKVEGVAELGRVKSGKQNSNGVGDSKGSDPKSTGITSINLEQETFDTLHIVQLSDDEDAEDEGRRKQNPSLDSPITPTCPETKRKAQGVEKQACIKRCKFNGLEDGKLWETDAEMRKAFETDKLLCMESVCALYRRHQSLGVWMFCLRNRVFEPKLANRGVALGKLLTGEDPAGKMKMSLADFEREDPRGVADCRLIAQHHYKLLFEIYNTKLDPSFIC